MNRPGITKLGKVTDDGHTVSVTGWGLTTCATRCSCHLGPVTGNLAIYENQHLGLLGLVQHRVCHCCKPWTAGELAQVLLDLHDVAMVETA